MIHTVKGLSIVNAAEVDVCLEFPCFFCEPMEVGNLIFDSSAFSKSQSLYIWKFLVHVLLKPSLKDLEHYFGSMWNECNCAVVWTLFGIVPTLRLEWKLTFSSPMASDGFSKFADILNALTVLSFRIWNSSAGILSPPLALLVVMLPKAHLTSHLRMLALDEWPHAMVVIWVIKTFFCTVLLCIPAASS